MRSGRGSATLLSPPGDPMRYDRALQVAIEAARAAGDLLRAGLHRPGGPGGPRSKCPLDVDAEEVIRGRLVAAFPGWALLGEERGRREPPGPDPEQHVWLVDPNDGTAGYQKGWRGSAVSIGLLRGGVPVVGVVFAFAAPDDRGDLIAWAEGQPLTRNGAVVTRPAWPARLEPTHTVLVSQGGDGASERNARAVAPARFRVMPSIAYRLALAAAGDAVACASLHGPGNWDVAAGHALLRAVGGELVDDAGRPFVYRADGSCASSDCFGGAPGIVEGLARADWGNVQAHTKWRQQDGPFELARPVPGETEPDAGRLARAQGALLGQLAGDALGSFVEFQSAARIAASHPDGVRDLKDGGTWNTLAGQPTDDSELALLLARALVASGQWDDEAVARGYAWWYASGPFDVGTTTSQALRPAAAALAAKRPVAEAARAAASSRSASNGALMRVSPLGIFGHAASADALAGWARADAQLTHPNPVCQDASAVFAVTIARAVSGGSAPAVIADHALTWARAAGLHAEVVETLEAARTAPPADYQTQQGWVRVALGNAFWQLRHAPTLEAGVVDTVRRGGDTDTNGAIAGALLGAVHGRDAVPFAWRDRVLTCRPLAGQPGVHQPRPKTLWPVDADRLAERLLVVGRGAAHGQQSSSPSGRSQ